MIVSKLSHVIASLIRTIIVSGPVIGFSGVYEGSYPPVVPKLGFQNSKGEAELPNGFVESTTAI